MSKGHMEALANLKAMRAAGLIGVTKPTVTKPAKGGRPKVHQSPADKRMAYRGRKATGKNSKE